MFNLLIVDDEEYICDSLFQIFSNQDMDLEISKAYCAQEALELLNRQRFDIVMTDIEMPGMSGIELMQEIARRWINCKIVFLTAHSKFEYIYTAMQSQNAQYLLKTEKIEKIIKTVRDLTEEIKQGAGSADILEKITREQRIHKERYRRYLITDILRGEINGSQLNQQYVTESLDCFKLQEPAFLFLAAADSDEVRLYQYDKVKRFSIIQEVEKTLSAGCICRGVFLERDYLVWMVQPNDSSIYVKDDEKTKLCFSMLNGNMPVIQNMIEGFLGVPVSIVITSEPAGWENINEVYQRLKQTLFYHQRPRGREILLYSGRGDEVQPNEYMCDNYKTSAEDYQILERLIRDGDTEEIERYFEKISYEPSREDEVNPYIHYETYSTIVSELISMMNRYHLTAQVEKTHPMKKLMNFEMHPTWKAATGYLMGIVLEIVRLRTNFRESSINRMIESVNSYIDTHLDKDLSLNQLAEIIHYNPAYFSRIYKDITGENVKKYISGARIKRAKELLANSSLKIAEISEMVGFDRPANFGRFFKDIVGVTPLKYRDSL